MSDGLEVVVGVLIGYVIGMFPSADLVTRLATRGTVDLRSAGSGNPGGLNAARVLGKKWGLLVIVLDVAKGALAGFAGLAIGDAAAYAAGTGVVAGHCWPVVQRVPRGQGRRRRGRFVLCGLPADGADQRVRHCRGGVVGSQLAARDQGRRWWSGSCRPSCGGRPISRCGGDRSPAPGSSCYSLLGAGMIQARFMMTARSGGGSSL